MERQAQDDGFNERERRRNDLRKKSLDAFHEALREELSRNGQSFCGQEPGERKKPDQLRKLLWNVLLLHQGLNFETAKKLTFTYSIRGYEMFVSRKDKSITRSTVELAFHKALELMKEDIPITGPKKLGTFGASYLYPIFIKIGVIPEEKTRKKTV